MARIIRTLNLKNHVSLKRVDNLTVVKLEIFMIALITLWFIAHNG